MSENNIIQSVLQSRMARDFNDRTKQEARGLSSGYCCICHQQIVKRFHHLIPYEEGGDSSIDNCVPICVNCHSYVHNTGYNRDEIKILRDSWYRHVKDNKTPDIISQELKIQDEMVLLDNSKKLDMVIQKVEELKYFIESGVVPTNEQTASVVTTLSMATSSIGKGDITECPQCMKTISASGRCPYCGFDIDDYS